MCPRKRAPIATFISLAAAKISCANHKANNRVAISACIQSVASGGVFAWRAPGALLLYELSRL